MSTPQNPKPAKLVVGLFVKEKRLINALYSELSGRFGPVDLISSWFPFDFTTYYAPEMGNPLFRRVLAFKTLVEQKSLAEIKIATNDLELKFLQDRKRTVNIDPGYMLRERFVLATGKNYAHRIYQDKGIYADLTLIYQKGGFRQLPWTYPDYAANSMLVFLEIVRKKYINDLICKPR